MSRSKCVSKIGVIGLLFFFDGERRAATIVLPGRF